VQEVPETLLAQPLKIIIEGLMVVIHQSLDLVYPSSLLVVVAEDRMVEVILQLVRD